jgi:hypothetical protein
MQHCKFCDKECKNDNSLRNHQRLCPKNDDRVYVNGMTGKKGGNQYTKAEKLGLPKPIISLETSKKLSDSVLSRSKNWQEINGKKISKTVNEKVANGEWHTSLAKHMHIDYNGVDMHGNWELQYAIDLDSKNIKWIKCKESFGYIFEGKPRRYTPDFYLIETDEYIEIKGYKTEKDDVKWSQFPKDKVLKVLMKNELTLLGIKL